MFAFIGNIGPWELVFILAIALIVVGPGKLPEVAKSMGKAMNEFKKSTSGVKRDLENAMRFEDEPVKQVVEAKTVIADDLEQPESAEAEKKTEN